jgi:hypothetical protein
VHAPVTDLLTSNRVVRLQSGALVRIGDFVRLKDGSLGRVGAISWKQKILHQPIVDCDDFQNLMPTLELDPKRAFEGRQVCLLSMIVFLSCAGLVVAGTKATMDQAQGCQGSLRCHHCWTRGTISGS